MAAAVGISALGAQAQLTFSAPLNISHNPGGGPQLYIESGGNIDAVWLQNPAGASSPDVFFSRSTENGVSFSTPVDASSRTAALIREWPVVAVDGNGRIDIAWLNEYQAMTGAPLIVDIYFTQSTDGGKTFSQAQNITLDGAAAAAARFDCNVESDGHIDVAWTDISTGFVQVYFSHSTDSGATFSAPRDISNAATGSNGSGGAEEPFMAVDSGGNLNIIWTNYPVTPPYGPKTDVYYVRSTDGGSTFSNPENVTNVANMSPSLTAYAYQLSLDGTGNIDVFWTTGSATGFVTRSTDHGATFSASSPLPNFFRQTAVDAAGSIDVFSVQSQIISGSPFNGTAVYQDTGYFSRSADGGVTFSAPQAIATGYHNSTSQGSMQADMIVDATGAIEIATALGSNATGNPADLYVLRSTDNGATFTTTDVSNDGGYATYYIYAPTIAADSNGNASVSWEDSTQGNNIFFSRGVNPIPPPATLESLTFSTPTVNSPGLVSGTITLSGPAPKGGSLVVITSSDPRAVIAQPRIAIPAGKWQMQFAAVALPIFHQTTVTISGSYGGATDSATITVNPFRLVSLHGR
ncbi:MAG TPA: sialidase family protein [Candidatus Binatia bacterium]|nr:sialidase family protein [Candidatus Binatia bacterium]